VRAENFQARHRREKAKPTELMVTRVPQLGLGGITIRSCVVLMRRSKRHLYSIIRTDE
jgi:hypothetical protein